MIRASSFYYIPLPSATCGYFALISQWHEGVTDRSKCRKYCYNSEYWDRYAWRSIVEPHQTLLVTKWFISLHVLTFPDCRAYSNLLETNVGKTLCSQQYALHLKCCMTCNSTNLVFACKYLIFNRLLEQSSSAEQFRALWNLYFCICTEVFIGLTGIWEDGFW